MGPGKLELKRNYKGYLLIMPAVIGVFIIALYPLIKGISMSFLEYDLMKMTSGSFGKFNHFNNFHEVISDEVFVQAFGNTIVWTLSNLVIQIIIGTFTAMVLNRNVFFKGGFRLITIVPWVMPSAVAALTWRFLYDSKLGIINTLLLKLGIIDSAQSWLGNIPTAMPAVIIESIWKGMPFVMIMVLSSLQGIPYELYESANIDGASKFQAFISITLPMIKDTLAITSILTTIWTINNFNAVWLMTKGGPLNATEILFTYAYRMAFERFDFGLSAVISTIIFILIAVLTTVYIKLAEREEH